MDCILTVNKRRKLPLSDDDDDDDDSDDDDESDLPPVQVQHSTNKFYKKRRHEVLDSDLFDSLCQCIS